MKERSENIVRNAPKIMRQKIEWNTRTAAFQTGGKSMAKMNGD
jgi:hypothetical protein